jgi:hypothetical protein
MGDVTFPLIFSLSCQSSKEEWRKSLYRNSLYYNELAIFSEEPLEAQPGLPEVPYIRVV